MSSLSITMCCPGAEGWNPTVVPQTQMIPLPGKELVCPWEGQPLFVREWQHSISVSPEIFWSSNNLVDAKVLLFVDFGVHIEKLSLCFNWVICFRIRQS